MKSMVNCQPRNEPLVIHFDVQDAEDQSDYYVQGSQTPNVKSFKESEQKSKQPKSKAELFELRKQMVK